MTYTVDYGLANDFSGGVCTPTTDEKIVGEMTTELFDQIFSAVNLSYFVTQTSVYPLLPLSFLVAASYKAILGCARTHLQTQVFEFIKQIKIVAPEQYIKNLQKLVIDVYAYIGPQIEQLLFATDSHSHSLTFEERVRLIEMMLILHPQIDSFITGNDKNKRTLLNLSVYHRDPKIARTLISLGAKPNNTNTPYNNMCLCWNIYKDYQTKDLQKLFQILHNNDDLLIRKTKLTCRLTEMLIYDQNEEAHTLLTRVKKWFKLNSVKTLTNKSLLFVCNTAQQADMLIKFGLKVTDQDLQQACYLGREIIMYLVSAGYNHRVIKESFQKENRPPRPDLFDEIQTHRKNYERVMVQMIDKYAKHLATDIIRLIVEYA